MRNDDKSVSSYTGESLFRFTRLNLFEKNEINSEKLIWPFPKSTLEHWCSVEKPDIFHILNMNIPWIISRPNDDNRDEILKGLTCMIDTRLLNELLIE